MKILKTKERFLYVFLRNGSERGKIVVSSSGIMTKAYSPEEMARMQAERKRIFSSLGFDNNPSS